MYKQIIDSWYYDVYFTVDLFKLSNLLDVETMADEINAQINSDEHDKAFFVFTSYVDAVSFATSTVIKDDRYNYSVITLEAYNGSEQVMSEIVANYGADEVDKSKLS